jgi:sRNA-binding carbon storage regulator CsrA
MPDTNRGTLCITRKSGEAVIVGDARIEFEIVGPNKAFVRITADRNIPIVREELLYKQQETCP